MIYWIIFLAIIIFLWIFINKNKKANSKTSNDSSLSISITREYGDTEHAIKLTPPKNLKIKYKDYEGKITQREIIAKTLENGYIEAFCKLRNDKRTFKINRIKECIDLDTGEIIKVDKIASSFGGEKLKRQIRTSKNYDEDNFEGWFYEEVEDDYPVCKEVHIEYIDGAGCKTSRDIFISRYGKASFGYFLLAFCRQKEANRSFRVDRIKSFIDLETGEMITDIKAYLLKAYHETDEYKKDLKRQKKEEIIQYIDYIFEEHKVLIKVLTYLVKCDGTFNAKEKAIFKEVFVIVENNELLTNAVFNKIFKKLPEYMPTERAFKINAKKVINTQKYNINISDIAWRTINTQRTMHPAEKEALEYLESLQKITNKEVPVWETKTKKPTEEELSLRKQCPKCNSNYTIKKGTRKLKTHSIQRYQCQDCKGIFSERITNN